MPNLALDGRPEAPTRGPSSTATWTSPSSIAVVMRRMATLVGPKAVHMALASRPSRVALSCASVRNAVVVRRSSARDAATADADQMTDQLRTPSAQMSTGSQHPISAEHLIVGTASRAWIDSGPPLRLEGYNSTLWPSPVGAAPSPGHGCGTHELSVVDRSTCRVAGPFTVRDRAAAGYCESNLRPAGFRSTAACRSRAAP